MGKRCPVPGLYERARSKSSHSPEADSTSTLPVDEHGACIFHSQEIAWKRENDFEGQFAKLVQILDVDETEDYYDFSEFRFLGNDLKTGLGSEQHTLCIADMVFRKRAYFTGAVFLDSLELDGVCFEDGATFAQATFAHDLKIMNARFRGLDFINAQFAQLALFSKIEFLSYTLFHNAQFMGVTGGYVVKFADSRFQGIADFSGAVFGPLGNESSVGFLNVQFQDFTDFRKTRFHNQVVFADVSFAGVAEFIDTLFDTARSSARYRGAAVEFSRIEVMAEAVLTFMSTDPQRKIFNHDVQMSFKEDPVGLVEFENVNFNRFTPSSRDRLTRLSKLGRVEIGPGCIKYRFQTDVRTISVSQGNTPLILELCQTFTNYFTVSNGMNLGFEIVNRDETNVSFFYFTDEDISKATFLAHLARTEQRLWSLLSTSSSEQLLAIGGPGCTALSPGKENALINSIDGISALLGTFFRVGARIAIGAWKEADTKALLDAIRFNDRGVENLALGLHRVLVDRYTGETLLAFNLQQNEQLPEMKRDRVFLEGQVSALNETVKLLAAKGDTYVMGDTYEVRGQSVVGPNAHARDMTFNNGVSRIDESMDLYQLAEELSRLREAMSQEAKETDQENAVGDVAKAEQAARAEDLPKVVEYLKSAGGWALDVATKVGVSLASEALKRSLGMK